MKRKEDSEADLDSEQEQTHKPGISLHEREQISSTARLISAQFNCRVEEAPRHWREYLLRQRERNRRRNTPAEQWLKQHGLYEKAQKFLTDSTEATLIAVVGKPITGTKPRIKLCRFPFEDKAGGAGRGRYPAKLIQLLPTASDAEIEAECALVAELWPEPHQWRRASGEMRRDWEKMTLAEAMLELLLDRKRDNGKNLARLLFRNPAVEQAWKLHQRCSELRRQGQDVFTPEIPYRSRKRGISLREFRQRYKEGDLAEARKQAVKGLAYPSDARDDELDTKRDEDKRRHFAGMSTLSEKGKPILPIADKMKAQPRSKWAAKMGPRLKGEINNLTPEHRKAIAAVLGCSLQDYANQPCRDV